MEKDEELKRVASLCRDIDAIGNKLAMQERRMGKSAYKRTIAYLKDRKDWFFIQFDH